MCCAEACSTAAAGGLCQFLDLVYAGELLAGVDSSDAYTECLRVPLGQLANRADHGGWSVQGEAAAYVTYTSACLYRRKRSMLQGARKQLRCN